METPQLSTVGKEFKEFEKSKKFKEVLSRLWE
jgi:hypothetical protein